MTNLPWLVARAFAELIAGPPAPPTRSAAIGVVFVHGIGTQGQSATVREFAEPLVDYLREWHRTRGHPNWEPDASELSYGGTLSGPARVFLKWPAFTRGATTWPARRFVFAEAWWAARLEPPPIKVMIFWSARTLWRVIWKLITQFFQRIWYLLTRPTYFVFGRGVGPSASDPGGFAAVGEIISSLAFLLAYVVAAIAGYGVLLVLFVLAQIPIDAVQDFILVKALTPFLVENLGDHETYMYDELQALNIRAAVGDAVRALVQLGCEQICVLAHSQGAPVAFDGLCALGREDPATAAHVRKLITFGGALNRAFAQGGCPPRLLRATLPAHIFWLDIWSQYDPVAGGYLRRSCQNIPPLVQPAPGLRSTMWWNAKFDGPMPDQVTNGMNPLLDHGGYFKNPDQFANRVLAEIDDPDDYYQHSRFYFRTADGRADSGRVRRRRTRISTLAWWRLFAIGGLGVALLMRGLARLTADGHAVWVTASTLPGHEFLTAPGKILDGIGAVLDAIGRGLTSAGVLADFVQSVRDFWHQVAWSDALLAGGLYAAAFAALYALLLWALYRRWREREEREAVAELLPVARSRPLLIIARTAGVVGMFADAVIAVGAP